MTSVKQKKIVFQFIYFPAILFLVNQAFNWKE